MTTENNLSENEENKISPEETQQETSENKPSNEENTPEEEETEHSEDHVEADLSLADVLKEMEKIINSNNAGENYKKFNALKENMISIPTLLVYFSQ